ncbi:unnamed protein product, partial [Mesorhabditis spiculigera]
MHCISNHRSGRHRGAECPPHPRTSPQSCVSRSERGRALSRSSLTASRPPHPPLGIAGDLRVADRHRLLGQTSSNISPMEFPLGQGRRTLSPISVRVPLWSRFIEGGQPRGIDLTGPEVLFCLPIVSQTNFAGIDHLRRRFPERGSAAPDLPRLSLAGWRAAKTSEPPKTICARR